MGKVVLFHLGKLTAEQLLAAASQVPKATEHPEQAKREQRCEAQAYIGLRLEVAGKRDAALEHYRKAAATKVYRFSEWKWARVALGRLTKKGAK